MWQAWKTQLLCKPVGQPKNFVKMKKKKWRETFSMIAVALNGEPHICQKLQTFILRGFIFECWAFLLKKKLSLIEDSPKYLHKRLWRPYIGVSTDQTLDLCPSNSSFHWASGSPSFWENFCLTNRPHLPLVFNIPGWLLNHSNTLFVFCRPSPEARQWCQWGSEGLSQLRAWCLMLNHPTPGSATVDTK